MGDAEDALGYLPGVANPLARWLAVRPGVAWQRLDLVQSRVSRAEQ